MSEGNRIASLVIGGLFLGIWLWVVLFEIPQWLGWGVLGLALAGTMYAGRLANPMVRTITWVVLGIAVGLLLAAAFLRETPDLLATVLTFAGGALVVSGLPLPGEGAPVPARHP